MESDPRVDELENQLQMVVERIDQLERESRVLEERVTKLNRDVRQFDAKLREKPDRWELKKGAL